MADNISMMEQIILAKQFNEELDKAESTMNRLNAYGQKETKYLSIKDLMQRWHCSYDAALAFMHRKGSGAIKPSKLLLISLKEVEQYERTTKLHA